MTIPKISVCVATYNGARFIKAQLASILPQLREGDEVVISDDGSTDGTRDIINGMADNHIHLYAHAQDPTLRGKHLCSFYYASYNFENAIQHATGDIVFLADQDDVWAPDRIEKTLPFLEDHDFAMCNYAVIDQQGKVIIEKYHQRNPIGESLAWNLWKIPFRGCCMALRKQALDAALPFPKNCINHDIWIGALLTHKGYKCAFIDEPLHYYRCHTSNVSPVIGKSGNSLFFKIGYRARFLYQILTYKQQPKRA